MKVFITGSTDPNACELCGKVADLRPYGPNGESICFQCGMKDEAKTKKTFARRMEQGAVDIEDIGAVIRGNLKRQ